jgi:sugar phosphate permease
MKRKIGVFFLLVGIVQLFIFWGSVQASLPNSRWLFIGFLAIIGGLVMIFRGRETPESQRFRTIRKLRGKKRVTALKDKT